jgi:lipoate-protein ligase A
VSTAGEPWRVERRRGPPGRLLDDSAAGARPGATRLIRILRVDRPALVLGSGQPDADVDAAAAATAGVDVVRRRTGGGAVLVTADSVLWLDLIIPVGDALWMADVRQATWWVGETWAAALKAVGAGSARVWKGGMRASAWSRRVCFAGLGPGEVCVGGRKVVGISQRRTSHAVLFQTAALLRWDPGALLALLPIDDPTRAGALADIRDRAEGVGSERASALTQAVLDALPGGVADHRQQA